MEAIQEKEMMRSLQPVSGKQYQRDEKKRGKEGGHFHLCMYRTTCEGLGHKFYNPQFSAIKIFICNNITCIILWYSENF